ncbi:hypothetical protein GOBAR_AA27174 [Gossypium barbadense]|uniref:Uncharacterized protein n=1 Tax=Gossypium barbadense TaxID=3634 RepID=A0A2P5WQW7_GOSBA|nr:hypothetical protein GOBAR_AA27174 [Gossypium barbadense]
MEGLVCDLKRNSNKDVMVLDPQVVEEGMIVDDIDGVEVSGAKANGIIAKIGYLNSFRYDELGSFYLFYYLYESSCYEEDELWHFLCFLVVSVEGPSMLAGGFNSILDGGERKGGASLSREGCKRFREIIRQ